MSKVSRPASFLRCLFSYSDRQRSGRKCLPVGCFSFLQVCLLLMAVLGLSLGGQTAAAATVTWDPAMSGGTAVGGTGNWADDGVSSQWLNGSSSDQAWNDPTYDTAVFAGSSGTVTVQPSVPNVGGLVFASTGYVLTGGTLNLTGGGSTPGTIFYSGTGNGAVINSALIDNSGITVTLGANTSTLTLGGNFSGVGNLTQFGGILALGGNNINYGGSIGVSSSGSTPASLKISNVLAVGGVPSVTISNNSLLSTATGGTGTFLDLTALTANGTIFTPINLTMDSVASTLNASILGAPGTGNTLGLSGSIHLSGAGLASIYNNGAGTVGVNYGIYGSAGGFGVRGSGLTAINGLISLGTTPIWVMDGATMVLNMSGTWGATNIGQGTLRLGAANALPSSTIVTIGQGTASQNQTLDLNGFSQTIAGLTSNLGSGNTGLVTSVPAATLTLNDAGISYNYGGNLTGAGLALAKLGTGTLTLSGSNTYGGVTNISAGTLAIGVGGVLGTGGNYSGTISNSGALAVQTNSNQTFGGAISGNGALYQLGNGLTTLAASNTYTGATTISAGTLMIGGGGVLGSGGIYNGAISDNGVLAINTSSNQTLAGLISGAGALTQIGGTLNLTGTNTNSLYTGAISVSTSGATAGSLKLSNSTALGGAASVTITDSSSTSGVSGGSGTTLDLTSLTTGGTISTPINLVTDAVTNTYRASILTAPAAGNTLTLSGLITPSGVAATQIYNTGAGTVAVNGNVTGSSFTGNLGREAAPPERLSSMEPSASAPPHLGSLTERPCSSTNRALGARPTFPMVLCSWAPLTSCLLRPSSPSAKGTRAKPRRSISVDSVRPLPD